MNSRPAHTRTEEIEDRIAESIAAKVIEIVRAELAPEPAPAVHDEFMDASDVARLTGFSRTWVYANAGRLGAYPVGDGKRPRLRFDPAVVSEFVKTRARCQQAEGAARPGATPHHVPRVSPMARKRKAN